MVKLFSTDHTYKHPFERVTSASWRKYPNDFASHVRGMDTYDRHLDSQGRLVSHRLMSCESAVPSWLSSFGVPSQCFVAEVSVVDPVTQTMVVKSRNLTGGSLIQVEETCTYSAVPNTSDTHYTQSARISAFLPMLSSRFEEFSRSNLSNKSKEGMAHMEDLCQRIQKDGVLSLFRDAFGSASPAVAPISS